MRSVVTLIAFLLLALTDPLASPARADLMIIGNDANVTFDAECNRAFVAPGKDSMRGPHP
ncbi:MAG TPA: hypothetical protein VFS98_21970 [Methylomirabilota bacterium]|nr:hypothetical protein [Methylomirabilota bacterium]